MVRYFDLELVVVGPVLSKGSEPGDPGLDAVALRSPDGSLVINGKHIHGRCRHAAMELAELSGNSNLGNWAVTAFGPKSIQKESERGSGDWKPTRSRLSFEELRCTYRSEATRIPRDFRIKKDDQTEAGEEQMLAVAERAGEHGAELKFAGKVRVVCESDQDFGKHRANLLRALRWLTNIGGVIGAGYGVLRNVKLTVCETPPGMSEFELDGPIPNSVKLRLNFSEPFCLAAPQLDENIFRSLDYVPGGAIAGAIQRALCDVTLGTSQTPSEAFPTLCKHFNDIRFRQAFPATQPSKVRPIPTPLSWVSITRAKEAKEGKEATILADVALVGDPALFKIDEIEYVPNFQPDWKGKEDVQVRKATGWVRVAKELRTYTEIERTTGVAKKERLYGYELVRPENTDWVAAMDIPIMEEVHCKSFFTELQKLLNEAPLLLGKTDARATLSISSLSQSDELKPHNDKDSPDYWIATLASDALLLNIEDLAGKSQVEFEAAYRSAWQEIGQSATRMIESPAVLQHYYSLEKLVGGNYLYHRFRDRNQPYAPYLITCAGSVFVLTSDPNDRSAVQEMFRGLLRTGLPLIGWAKERFKREDLTGQEHPGDYWENCPFIPNNGYGEIVVNHQAQIERLHMQTQIQPTPVNTVVTQ